MDQDEMLKVWYTNGHYHRKQIEKYYLISYKMYTNQHVLVE